MVRARAARRALNRYQRHLFAHKHLRYPYSTAVTALKPENAVESLRDIVHDLLVPELKAIKAELGSQRRENETHFAGFRLEFAAVRTENKITSDSIQGEVEGLRVELRLRDEKQSQALNALPETIGTLMEVRERLAVLEDRVKRS